MTDNTHTDNGELKLSKELLHDLRMLSEKHFGNETYGKYLAFNHELQRLLKDHLPKSNTDTNVGVAPTKSSGELESIPMVNGLDCPACGHPTLILGNGGYITCSLDVCPNPDYSESLATQTTKLQAEASDAGFKEGQRVGQHQAAERLYRHITAIYMFRDGDKKATAIADTNATDLLKDCEKYLNHNAKAYHAYLKSDRYKRFHPAELEREHKIGEDGE